jgi:hypothetical protein
MSRKHSFAFWAVASIAFESDVFAKARRESIRGGSHAVPRGMTALANTSDSNAYRCRIHAVGEDDEDRKG